MKKATKQALLILLALTVVISAVTLCSCKIFGGSKAKLTATYDDSHVVYEGDSVDSIKPFLTVTYTDENGSSTRITDFTLSGTLQKGASKITIRYNGLTYNITVNVLERSNNTDEYTVIFIADGVTVSTQKYTAENKTIDVPQVPTKTGYNGAWEEYMLTAGNVTVNAMYTAKQYTITLDYDGATGNNTKETINVTYDKPIGALPNPTKDGCDFVGWYLDESQVESDTVWNIDNNTATIAAKWKVQGSEPSSEEYTVTFVADNQTVSIQKYTADNKNIDVPKVPVKTGYNGAWEEYTLTTGNITVNALYIAKLYTITLEYDGATGGNTQLTITVTYDQAVGTLPTPEKTGYDFNGWYLNGYQVKPDTVWTVDNDTVKIVAQWKRILVATEGLSYRLSNDMQSYSVTGMGTAIDTDIVIPNSFNGKPVTEIQSNAFNGYGITSVYIPNSVTSIGSSAFLGCSSLTDVTISIGTITIGDSAFRNCGSLTNVTIGNTVSTIGSNAFAGCSSLTSIVVPDSVTSIPLGTFSGCSSLESITLPFVGSSATATTASASTLFGYIFGTSSYTGGTSTQQHYGISSSETSTYFIPNSLRSVTITSGKILYGAFSGCTSLVSIIIHDSVTSIGDSAFRNCSGLISITIPNSVTTIGSSAFYGCSGLTSIVIPDSVTSIDSWAFYGCSKLESITLPFVGNKQADASTTISEKTGFGYIFGCTTTTNSASSGSILSEDPGTCRDAVYSGYRTHSSNGYLSHYTFYWYYVPSSLKKVTITSETHLVANAFYNCKDINAIILPLTLEKIADAAFFACNGLTGITIPDSVTYIGSSAFYNCNNLTSVTIGNSVTYIGSSAFSGCTSLVSMIIPDSVTSIGISVFQDCSNLTNVTIGNGVTSIYDSAFKNCSNLQFSEHYNALYLGNDNNPFAFLIKAKNTSIASCIINENTKVIADSAFRNCSSLTSIVIPDSVTSIGCGAFYGCSSLENITLPFVGATLDGTSYTNFLYIFRTSRFSFNDSDIPSSLKTVVITGGTKIYSSAFKNCSNLTSVTIPDSVTSIGSSAFYGCSSLESMTLPFVGATLDGTSNTYFGYIFGEGATHNNNMYVPSSLKTIVITGGTEIFISAFKNCNSLTSVTILDGVTSIGTSAFYNCSSLTSITISHSVTNIGTQAFDKCSSLTSIVVDDANSIYHSVGNCLIQTATKTLVLGCQNSVIPTDGSVTSIDKYAFSGCTSLASISIPDSITSIGSCAFENCSNLTSIKIPRSVTSISPAFYGCNSMESITLPFVGATFDGSSNTHFGYIFGGSQSVSPYYNQYVPSSLKTVIITGGTNISSSAFSDCTSLTSITIPDSVMSIGSNAFYNCSNLKSITIPDSVTEIDNSAFKNCSNLTSVMFRNGVTTIGDYAFYDCSSLTSIVIPDSVTKIGNGTFMNCGSLESITLPFVGATLDETRNTYFGYIFGYNNTSVPSSLKTVVITGGTEIFSSAFSGCKSIESVTIGNGVKTIGPAAFADCGSIESITLPFVGESIKTSNDTYQYPFGYIFGTSRYTGGVETTQYYYDSSTISTTSTTYYIPSRLKCVTITGGNILYGAFYNCSNLTSITIPNSLTTIGERAFYSCTNLLSITIPRSVTTIGSSAFDGCYKLVEVCNLSNLDITAGSEDNGCVGYYAKNVYTSTSGESKLTKTDDGYIFYIDSQGVYLIHLLDETRLTLPNSFNGEVYELYQYLFYNCSSLSSITIPDTVTAIGDSAFSGCTSLRDITIPNSVMSIGSNAFYKCSNIQSVYYTGNIEGWCNISFGNGSANPSSYAYNLYINNELVTSLVIPDTITKIKPFAFYNCSSLINVTLGDSVTTIGECAFYNCWKLTSITIPDSVTFIGDSAFYRCKKLISIIIPNSAITIGNYAFSNCNELTSITIGNGVTTIGNLAFGDCSNLETVYWNAIACTRAGSDSGFNYIFYGCSKLTTVVIDDNVTTIPSYAFYNCSNLSNITIPNSITMIGSYSFYCCSNLTSITIPKSVTTIGASAFSYCSSLTIYCEAISKPSGWNNGWKSVVNSIDSPIIWDCNNNSKDTNGYEYAVIDGVRYSFKNSIATVVRQPSNITVANIPSKITYSNEEYAVTSIDHLAFYDCRSLTSITIPDGVTSIDNGMFQLCFSLANVTIGNSVTTIGDYAFKNCDELTIIYYTGTEDDWAKISIGSSNTSLTNATRYYYKETEPELNADGAAYDGNYWHYVDGEVTVWKKEN